MAQTPPTTERLPALDQLRGLVMIVMALDHTRDFFSGAFIDPTDLARTTPALFLTRWVTHFCAPVFVLLAGAGAYLLGSRGRTRAEVSRYLLVRGLLLVVLELTIVNFSWHFDEQPGFILLQVIWALGWSMVALAGLVWLPRWAIAVFGVVVVAGHNLLDNLTSIPLGLPEWLWVVFYVPEVLPGPFGTRIYALYPLLPWIGVMALGYALGPIWQRPVAERRRGLLGLGLGLTLAFLVLRAINIYGNPWPWEPQRTPLFTLFSFINTAKYPPSLDFLLMTLGPALMALAWFDRPPGPIGRVLAAYGRVPLFFYVLHLPLIHALARFGAGGRRFDLPVVYVVWVGVVAALYLPCRAYARLKARRRAWLWKLL